MNQENTSTPQPLYISYILMTKIALINVNNRNKYNYQYNIYMHPKKNDKQIQYLIVAWKNKTTCNFFLFNWNRTNQQTNTIYV